MFVSSWKKVWLILLVTAPIPTIAQDTNYNPIQNAPDTLKVEAAAQRFNIDVAPGSGTFLLCNLQPGMDYSLYLNGPTECGARPFLNNNQAQELINNGKTLNFRALAVTEELFVSSSCSSKRAFSLSVGCQSCLQKEQQSRSAMGIMTQGNYTPQQLVQDVFIGGDCFDVHSASISASGNVTARGVFSRGSSSINIEEGVILSTGNISNASGPNLEYNAGNQYSPAYQYDEDLNTVLNGNWSTHDVTALEFDFTPTSDQISFEFVFASEEYCEYAGSDYNDVFGFFISGPGINGPFSNNAENIAIVPGSSDYVTINNVNHYSNSAYYVNNVPAIQHILMPFWLDCPGHPTNDGLAIDDIEYDGFTTVLTAFAQVIPCETYHIKLIVADVNDGYFDSAVLLKANSFNAGATALVEAEIPGFSGNVVFEGCEDGYFVFQRSTPDLTEPVVVNFTISALSTATAGLDYVDLPTSITIPPGDSVYYLRVDVLEDILIENNETIILELDVPCSCTIPFTEMQIADSEPLEAYLFDQQSCGPESFVLSPMITGGIPGYSFLWNSGDTSLSLTVNPAQTTTYTVTITDYCGNTTQTAATIEIVEQPTASLSGTYPVCPEDPSTSLPISLTGSGPWEISYSLNGAPPITVGNISETLYNLPVSGLGNYQLISVHSGSCAGQATGLAIVEAVNIQLSLTASPVSCPGLDDGSLLSDVQGGTAPYLYQWSLPGASSSDIFNLAPGTYQLTVTDAMGCSQTAEATIPLDAGVPEVEAGADQTLNCYKPELTLNGSGSVGSLFSYQWTTLNGHILSGANSLNPTIDQGGLYVLEVENIQTGCTITDEVLISVDTTSPVAVIDLVGPSILDCHQPSTVLDGSSSQPGGNLNFEWHTSDGSIPSGSDVLPAIEVQTAGNYQLKVTNQLNGCVDQESIIVGSDMALPEMAIALPDMLNCTDTVIQLNASASSQGPQFIYSWTTTSGQILNGANSLYPNVNQPGIYELIILNQATNCSNIASVEVLIDTIAPHAEAVVNESLDCDRPEVWLDGSGSSEGPQYSYHWFTTDGNLISGTLSPTPTVNTAGTYLLEVTNSVNGCSATDEVIVEDDTNYPYDVVVEPTPPLCNGGEGSLTIASVAGGDAPFVYSVDGGQNWYSENLFAGLIPGSYQLMVQDISGCVYEKEVMIPDVPPIIVSLVDEVELQLGESYQLTANTNVPPGQIDSIIWSPADSLSCVNCLNPTARPTSEQLYSLTIVDDKGCRASDEVLFRVDKERKVFIPNAFTPNNDGINDRFRVFADVKSVAKIKQMQVFSRWGEQVFEAHNFQPGQREIGWDGTFKGKRLTPAVFVYMVEIEFIDGLTKLYKGDINLLD